MKLKVTLSAVAADQTYQPTSLNAGRSRLSFAKHVWKPIAQFTMREIGRKHALKLGICMTCRLDPIDYRASELRCSRCLKVRSKYEVGARLRLKQAGICERCRDKPIYFEGGRLCQDCILVIREYSIKNRPDILAREKDRIAARVTNGECARCSEKLEAGIDTGQLCVHCSTKQIDLRVR